MKVSAVAPASPDPASQKAAPEAAEMPAVPFEETLQRVQAKGKAVPAVVKPVQPSIEEAETEQMPEELPAEEGQAAEPALTELAGPALEEVPAPSEPEEPLEMDAEPSNELAVPLAAMPTTAASTPPAQRAIVEDPPTLPDAVPGSRSTLPQREPAVQADVRPAQHTTDDAPVKAVRPALPDDLPVAPSHEQAADSAELPARPEPAIQTASTSPVSAPAGSAAPEMRSPAPVSAANPSPAIPREAAFADTNHPTIINTLRTQALPDGGRMQIRLDPPQLGAMEIHVEVRDGVLTASFQTSSSEATRLLSHSLSQLKHSLESQGLSVDRLQVQQAPRDANTSADANARDNSDRQQQSYDHASQQEQQRREMLRRLWRRVAGEQDPLDLLA